MYPKRNMIEYRRSESEWRSMFIVTNPIRIRVFLADIADYRGLSNTKKIVDEILEKLTPEEKSYLKSASLPKLMEKAEVEKAAFIEFPQKYIEQMLKKLEMEKNNGKNEKS